MSEPIISVCGLSKAYRIYSHPSQMIMEALTGHARYREFLALDNISFDVHPGSVVGLLGRNGAGKSTLLRIIARTLDATGGSVVSKGRISAILELGTGFHLDYTGRENIYFGGICLGMSRQEMHDRVDEIIAFSELEQFIDQPFRTYSSGMQARLTFSVATCVDPDILIIDEALSVGDAKFALKSFDRIREFKRRGKAILFVSHSINQVTAFCDYAILLDHGRAIAEGDPNKVGNIYHELLFGPEDGGPLPIGALARQAAPVTSIPTVAETSPEEASLDTALFDTDDKEEDIAVGAVVAEDTAASAAASLPDAESASATAAGPTMPSEDAEPEAQALNADKEVVLTEAAALATEAEAGPLLPGRVTEQVETEAAVAAETNQQEELLIATADISHGAREHRYGNGAAVIVASEIRDMQGRRRTRLRSLETYEVHFTIRVCQPISNICYGIVLRDARGLDLFGGDNEHLSNIRLGAHNAGDEVNAKIRFRANLTGGMYFLTLALANSDQTKYDLRFDALHFEVEPTQGIHHTSLVNLEVHFELSDGGVVVDRQKIEVPEHNRSFAG